VNLRFGFMLDAAANERNTRCPCWCGDGLTEPWATRTWCNPPYSLKQAFIERAIEQTDSCTSVLLLPASVETRWFRHALAHCTQLAFLCRRVSFLVLGQPLSGNPSGSALFVFGEPLLDADEDRWWFARGEPAS
jgi:hypothetical protein